MVSACTLLRCQKGKWADVSKGASEITEVKTVFPTLGRWDAVALIEAPDLKSVSEAVLKINALPWVESTETLVEVTVH